MRVGVMGRGVGWLSGGGELTGDRSDVCWCGCWWCKSRMGTVEVGKGR